jgi:hypothetical protein
LFRLPPKKVSEKKNEPSDDRELEAVREFESFLLEEKPTPKVFLIEGVKSLLRVKKFFKPKKNRKGVLGVIVLDNPGILFNYGISVLDAEKTEESVWWKKKGFLGTSLLKEIRAQSRNRVRIHKVGPIKDEKFSSWEIEKKEVKPSYKVRGLIGQFIQSIKVHVKDGSEKQKLKSVLGYTLGVEKKTDYEVTVKSLVDSGVETKVFSSLKKWEKSKSGDHLIKTFYLMQKGKSFSFLQRKFQSMHMDDWLMLQEYVPSTCKYRFFRKPTKL